MTVEIISWSISTKVWYRAGIELATPGSAVRHASVARHVTDCATRLNKLRCDIVTSFQNYNDVIPVCGQRVAVRFLTFPRAGRGVWDRIELSHIGKNNGNPDLMCENKSVTAVLLSQITYVYCDFCVPIMAVAHLCWVRHATIITIFAKQHIFFPYPVVSLTFACWVFLVFLSSICIFFFPN